MQPEPRRWSLRRRIVAGLIGYVLLLSAVVAVHGYLVNERAEELVWESLLRAEIAHFEARRSADPAYHWPNTEILEMFTTDEGLPPAVAHLQPGVHDEVMVEGRERVLLVRDVGGERVVLALDIGDLERREQSLGAVMLGATLALLALLAGVVVWGVGRLTRPLLDLARGIAGLQPEQTNARVALLPGASAELAVIAGAMNAYLERNECFVERERAFVNTTSHELRTPLAIIAGAAENALADTALAATTRAQLLRIRRTARDVETLTALLLVLAKEPARLADISERVALDRLLPEIVEDHRHLCADKQLVLHIGQIEPFDVVAPPHIVRAAVGNLLRNAIENSDRGEILIALDAAGAVSIDDPGHGMSPEEVSAIYSRLARGGEGDGGGGIGLALIGRLCEHLGWRLAIESQVDRGSRVVLAFAPTAR